MKGYYKIVILIVISWIITYLPTLFSDTKINPFLFSKVEIGISWYVYLVMILILFIIIAIIINIFARKTSNKLLIDITIINFIIACFSLVWFILFYDNPFSIPEFVIKIIVVLVIFVIIKLKGRRERYVNRDS